MVSDLENVTDNAAKLSIKPFFDTNWSDMPDDIKLECIGKMEFKERLSLRCTAKAERSLVDSQKIKFTLGRFWGKPLAFGFKLFRNNECEFGMSSVDINKSLELVKYVKKIGIFENLKFSTVDVLRFEEEFFTDDELFTAKKIQFNEFDMDQAVLVLRKMKNGVESIKFNDPLSDGLGQILANTHVQNVPYWHIRDYHHTDSLQKVAQMWVDKNSEIGFTFQVSVRGDVESSFEEFMEHFYDRIVSEN
ncbi:unnamed protein product [Caenorhabditis nigoni]